MQPHNLVMEIVNTHMSNTICFDPDTEYIEQKIFLKNHNTANYSPGTNINKAHGKSKGKHYLSL